MSSPDKIRIRQSKAELRNILRRERADQTREQDHERKEELMRYLASVGMGLRRPQHASHEA